MLYPCILITSSAISAVRFKSTLKYGITKLSPFTSIPSLVNISIISSLDIFIPSKAFTFSGSNGITFCSSFSGYTSIFSSTALPAPICSASSTALFIALKAISGDKPFSKRLELSVLKPNFLAVKRTLPLLNVAASNTTVFVSSVIPEFAPPITPATATGFSSSAITRLSVFKVLSISSNVVIFSFSFALLTIICFPATFSMSNACIGCPSSNIT